LNRIEKNCLANTTAVKSYDSLKHSNDECDAALMETINSQTTLMEKRLQERVVIKAVSFVWTRDGTSVFLRWRRHQGGCQSDDRDGN
jgi:hypothetical protein